MSRNMTSASLGHNSIMVKGTDFGASLKSWANSLTFLCLICKMDMVVVIVRIESLNKYKIS